MVLEKPFIVRQHTSHKRKSSWKATLNRHHQSTGNQGIAFLNSPCLMVEWNKTRRIPFSPDKSGGIQEQEWSVNDLEDALSYVCVWHGYWDSCATLLCRGYMEREDISHGFNVWKLLKTGSQGCSHELWGAVWMMGSCISLSALGSFLFYFLLQKPQSFLIISLPKNMHIYPKQHPTIQAWVRGKESQIYK